MQEIEMIPVDSTNISAVGYDGLTQKLRVEFKRGQLYEYSGVEAPVFDSFLRAPSKGVFFASQIAKRDAQKYPSERIR